MIHSTEPGRPETGQTPIESHHVYILRGYEVALLLSRRTSGKISTFLLRWAIDCKELKALEELKQRFSDVFQDSYS